MAQTSRTQNPLNFFEAQFETVGFSINDRALISSFAEEIRARLTGREVMNGEVIALRVFERFQVNVHVRRALPEKGTVTDRTQVRLYPLLRAESMTTAKEDHSFFSITIAPDERLRLLWENLIGIDDVKRKVLDHFTLCLDRERILRWFTEFYPKAASNINLIFSGLKGKVLLVGPSGTGKTCFARGTADALARKTGKKVALLEAGLLRDKLVGETGKKISRIFQVGRGLASEYIVLLFFDEFDAVATNRAIREQHDEVRAAVNILLRELENVSPEEGILVIAATNLLGLVDFAVDRRFDFIIEFGKPDFTERLRILRHMLEPFGLGYSIYKLARLTDGRTQADIVRLIREAVERAILSGRRMSDQLLFETLESFNFSRDMPALNGGVKNARWGALKNSESA